MADPQSQGRRKDTYLHFRLYIREDSGLNVVSLTADGLRNFTAEVNRGALLLSALNIVQDLPKLHFAVLWSLIYTRVKIVADLHT